MGEYGKYNVGELKEMTNVDDETSMRTIATGWVNTGSVLGTAKEALQERLEQLRKVWTAPSFGVFEDFINRTVANVDAAQTQADNRAEAAGRIATTAGWARDSVNKQHDAYMEIGGVFGEGDGDPFRMPYDVKARNVMQVALEEYHQQKPAMTQEVVQFRPIGAPEGIEGDPHWLPPGGDDWGPDGASGSNAADMSTLSAVSYGSNAVGSGPTLQSGGQVPVTTAPAGGGGGVPTPSGGGFPAGSPPVGGFPPGSKPPTAPPRLPTGPATNARNTLMPRGAAPASRTPGLPSQRGGVVRPGGGSGPNSRGAPSGRGGGVPGKAGRGLPKSRMAPKDLTQRVRPSGDVIGRRGANANSKPSGGGSAKPVARGVQPSVVRGAKPAAKPAQGRPAPVDNTNRGYTSRVINPRDRLSEASGHARTPYVGERMKHIPKPEPIGKRQEPESGASRARREIEAFRVAREERVQQPDGLSRPVIGNGVTNTADIHDTAPNTREPVEPEESFWQPRGDVVGPVIGKRHWDPDALEHDPGPQAFDPRSAHVEELEQRLARLKDHDPGPTAFDAKRRPADPWPQE